LSPDSAFRSLATDITVELISDAKEEVER